MTAFLLGFVTGVAIAAAAVWLLSDFNDGEGGKR